MLRTLLVASLFGFTCNTDSGSAPPAGGGGGGGGGAGGGGGQVEQRKPLVPKDHALYNRLEGTGSENACGGDGQCVKAGCSGEICAATKDIMSTCEALPVQIPASASCGCLAGECLWWTADGATLAPAPVEDPGATKPPGVPCGNATCADGETCIEYYGVAGPRGPRFQSCGIPCPNGKCRDGKKCVTIADGPGPVCQ